MRTVVALVALLLGLAPVVRAAEEPGPNNAGLDRKVVEVVKQVAALHKGARALHVEAVLATTVTRGKQTQQIEVTSTIDLERPNRFALRARFVKDANAGLEVVCDGKSLCALGRRMKQYTESQAPADLAGVGKFVPRFGHPTTGMLFQNVLAEDPDEVLLDGVTSAAYAGTEVVGGTRAHHLRLRQPDLDWELRVAAEGKPFVLKVASTTPTEDGKVVTVETYKNWKLDGTPDRDAFTFTPPADARKVKSLRPQPPKEG
jgi:hypothetical protein